MKDEKKSKKQLIDELRKIRKRAAKLEKARAERKRAEEQLQRSEQELRAIFDASDEIIFIKGQDGRYLQVNAAFSRKFQRPLEDIVGRKDDELFDSQEAERLKEIDRAILKRGKVDKREDVLSVAGETRIFQTTKIPLRADTGNIIGIVGFARDVTEYKRLEEQLHQAMKMEAVGRLAGGVAHDFNNALTPILAISEMLLMQLSPRHPMCEDLEEIKVLCERCAALTRQLLAFSRRQPLVPKVLDLNEVVAGVSRMLSRLIGEDVKLVKFLDPGLGKVKADLGQIEEVIANLAINARDAMPAGGRITIETANVELDDEYARAHHDVSPGPYVMLALSDTGTGMDAEIRSKIFEPFFTTKEKGSGLGLSTVYGIVKQSGGHLGVYSEPGQGTIFKIYLPRVEEKAEAPGAARPQPGKARGGSETILLVEDEESVRKIVKRVLSQQGYKVLEAPDGEEAVKLCERHHGPVHLVITDVVMPGMSGRELVERISPCLPGVKIIYFSGYTNNAIVHHGALMEGVNFIQKPFTSEALMLKIREVLDAEK